MARTFYFKDAAASGSNFLSLQDGGSAPSAATTGTGWTVGTTSADNYSLMAAGVERLASTFGASSLPDHSGPNNTLGDCFRTENPLTASFASDFFTIDLPVIAVTHGGDQDGQFIFDFWRGTNATGSGATLISSGAFGEIVNLTTGAEQVASLTGFLSGGGLTLVSEYLFLQLAWKIQGASADGTADVLIRVGPGASMAFSELLAPPPIEHSQFGGQQIIRRYRPVGY